jgi:4-amino-4-deoxy-L-arabinose transferase-like glycosyltransferase
MIANKFHSFLSWYYVYLLELNFFLLITAFIFSFKYIKKIFSEIQNKHLLLLILIAILGILSTSFLAPRIHRIFYDEDIYNDIAQNIAHNKKAVMSNEGYYENNELQVIAEEYNKQPPAYPYLISVIFRILGTNELFTFILNNIIFGLTIIVIFLISFLLFKDIFASFIACLSYIVIPINLQWFNTCAVEPSTAFFTSLAVLASLLYIKDKKPVNLFFVVTSLAFSLSFRTWWPSSLA